MNTRLKSLSPHEVAERVRSGRALLIDIREADEFARRRAKGAVSRPLSELEAPPLATDPAREVVFTCRSGMRTQANCDRLLAAAGGEAYVLDGGLDAWLAAGLPADGEPKAPLELRRQMQIAAGAIIILGVALGLGAHPAFFAIPAFVGAGLIFAGATGLCGMVGLLRLAPWNRALRP